MPPGEKHAVDRAEDLMAGTADKLIMTITDPSDKFFLRSGKHTEINSGRKKKSGFSLNPVTVLNIAAYNGFMAIGLYLNLMFRVNR